MLKSVSRARKRKDPGKKTDLQRCVRAFAFSFGLAAILLAVAGCSVLTNGSAGPPSPSKITVTVAPATAAVSLGQTQQFSSTVTGTSNTAVMWSVNGTSDGNSMLGTISEAGLYTAPQALPFPANVTITAASQADPQATGSATVALESGIVVNISPNAANPTTGTSQVFTASVTGPNSPNPAVSWSVDGVAGGNASLGMVNSTGSDSAIYTAPEAPPSPPTVSVTATSVADPSKSASATVTILCAASNSVSPASATLAFGQQLQFTAFLCASPDAIVTWDVNGVVGGNSTLGTITNNGSVTAVYIAPASLPLTNPVTIHATAALQSAAATVTIESDIVVTVSPTAVSLSLNQRATFTATVSNSSNTAVSWSVNGIPNGNTSVGQVCIVGSNPCVIPPSAAPGSVDYVVPAAVPTQNPVILTATSQADPAQSAIAAITILPVVEVTVSPFYAFLAPSGQAGSTLQFIAAVLSSTNQSVTWSVQSAVPGQGCSGADCGTITKDGFYTAPSFAPSPNAISIIAASRATPSLLGTATVALTSGPVIETLLPSSVTAGATDSFPLAVEGLNFVAGSGSSASQVLLNGIPRPTGCQTMDLCTISLEPSDVASAGAITIQIANPGTPGLLSNPVPVVVLPFPNSADVIQLSGSLPVAAGQDILVVEPTTAGATTSQINVDFIGYVTPDGTTCTAQGSSLAITRPSSGVETLHICVHGNFLDPAFTYAFSGPNDIAVSASSMAGLFPNLIELSLTLSSSAMPGVRTLFIGTPNNDEASATGILEVK